jgi:hypothetical protein
LTQLRGKRYSLLPFIVAVRFGPVIFPEKNVAVDIRLARYSRKTSDGNNTADLAVVAGPQWVILRRPAVKLEVEVTRKVLKDGAIR